MPHHMAQTETDRHRVRLRPRQLAALSFFVEVDLVSGPCLGWRIFVDQLETALAEAIISGQLPATRRQISEGA
jgi:hypothetical protein